MERADAVQSDLWQHGRPSLGVVQEAALRFGFVASTLEHVSDGIHTVWRGVLTEGGTAYLRLGAHNGVREDRLHSASVFLLHLCDHGVPACRPLLGPRGLFTEIIPWAEHHIVAMAVREVPGRRLTAADDDPRILATWGAALAGLHNAADHFVLRPDLSFVHWDDEWSEIDATLPSNDAALRRVFVELDSWLHTLPNGAAACGLTHGDMRPGNVLWDDPHIGIIDFDVPTQQWFAMDVARAMMELGERPAAAKAALLAAFLAGYRQKRPFPDFWEAHLGRFVRLRALCMYVWGLSGPLPPNSSGAWIASLRARVLSPAAAPF